MKIYDIHRLSAYFVLWLVVCIFAPTHLDPGWLLIGGIYFISCWFLAGLYLADVLHMESPSRIDYKEWFIKGVPVVNNVFGIYVDPIAWVNRHRCIIKMPTMMEIPTNFPAMVFGERWIAA